MKEKREKEILEKKKKQNKIKRRRRRRKKGTGFFFFEKVNILRKRKGAQPLKKKGYRFINIKIK
jgi:hypothetical protein